MDQEFDFLEAGRVYATKLLKGAYEKSLDGKDGGKELVVLQMMAVSVLATIMINTELSMKNETHALLDQVIKNIQIEYDVMKRSLMNGELEMVEAGIGQGKSRLH